MLNHFWPIIYTYFEVPKFSVVKKAFNYLSIVALLPHKSSIAFSDCFTSKIIAYVHYIFEVTS
jgi:hypothetical protein